MSIEIEHECDFQHCSSESEECYCDSHIEQIKQKAYDEGFKEGQASMETDESGSAGSTTPQQA